MRKPIVAVSIFAVVLMLLAAITIFADKVGRERDDKLLAECLSQFDTPSFNDKHECARKINELRYYN